jgi:phage N-6-adenine-methyltransferase
MTKYQLLPPLSAEQRDALKSSIEENGVLVAVEKDENGDILDGHHRLEICQELGIADYPVTVRLGMSEAEKRRYVRAINFARRHLDNAQKRGLIVEQIKEAPDESNRQIARWLGVDDKTVGTVRVELEKSAEIPHFSERKDPRTGNPTQPAAKPKTIIATTPQQADAAVKLTEVSGLFDGQNNAVSAAEIIHDANKTFYSTNANRHTPLMTSDSFEWYTPKEIIERVRFLLGTIDLDPCTSEAANNHIEAAEIFTMSDDGLKQSWQGHVYLNPPYGDTIGEWTGKLKRDYVNGEIIAAVALVPARTDTQWFRALADYPRCFLHGRLKFTGPNNTENSAPFPSAVIALGCDVQDLHRAFGDIGDVYTRFHMEK